MYRCITAIALISFALHTGALSAAEEDVKAKRDDIQKLMELTGSSKVGEQVMFQMIASFKKSMPEVPAEFWQDFKKEISGDELVKLIVPIYEKHFTHDDIKALIQFYESDIGKRFVAKQPVIVQESMAVGQKWGAAIGQKVQKKLEERNKFQP